MIQEFNVEKRKKIAICIIDNSASFSSGWTKEISINISDFLVHRFVQYDFDVYISDKEDEILKFVSKNDFYTHAVVVASGMSLGLSDRLFSAIENKCREDFFLSGHVLHRNENSFWKNGYYELHHQFYIVNLKEFTDIGCPEIGQFSNERHRQIEPFRSAEYLYDDHEVASWIKPGKIEKEYEIKCHGWNIISTALIKNKKLVDLGEDIRNNKKYLYYEYDHVFLRELPQIYHDQFFCNNFFPSWNSDNFRHHIDFSGPVDQYITVGIGIYWAVYLHSLGYTKNCRIIFTDINHNCLQFMKSMVEEWDGENYHEFYRKKLRILPNGFDKNLEPYIEHTKNEWIKFLEIHPNWYNIWKEVKSLKFEYVLIDYMGKYDLRFIERDKKTLMNLSDVFTHSPYTPTQSLKYRISCENRFINSLKNIDPEIYLMLTSRSADGYHLNKNRLEFGKIKDFDLTDINELKKPVWHAEDWHSPRILG